MKKLIKGKFSGTVLLGVLFFAAGCGSREEDSPPNYVVNRVQTGTTAGDTKAAGDLADKEADRVPTGGLSIIQEDIAGANGKDTEGGAEGGDAYGEDNNQEREEQEDQVGQENQGNQEEAAVHVSDADCDPFGITASGSRYQYNLFRGLV